MSLPYKKFIFFACLSQDCICDGYCCQNCEKRDSCETPCQSVIWAQNCLSDEDFLIKRLKELAENEDLWLVEVAAEKIREIQEQNKKMRKALEDIWRNSFLAYTDNAYIKECQETASNALVVVKK